MNNGNPLWDYIDHLKSMSVMESDTPKEYITCSACYDKFCPENEQGGLTGEFMDFCPKCVRFSNHVAYIRDLGITTEEAVFTLKNLKPIQ